MVIGHWSLVKRLRLRKGEKETGDRRQFRLLKLIVLTITTVSRTSPAGTERTPVRGSLAVAFLVLFSAKEKRTGETCSIVYSARFLQYVQRRAHPKNAALFRFYARHLILRKCVLILFVDSNQPIHWCLPRL